LFNREAAKGAKKKPRKQSNGMPARMAQDHNLQLLNSFALRG
jgi:hypothetical protein